MLELIVVLKKKKEKNVKKKIWIEISKDRKRSLKVKLSRLMAFSRLSFHSRCWKLGNKVIFSFLLGIILEVWKSQRLIFLLKKKKKETDFTSTWNNSFVYIKCFVVYISNNSWKWRKTSVFQIYMMVLFCDLWYNLLYKKRNI